ncbi:highly divergent homeobox isoform X2 [Xenopus tropicalis]|uniref:Highly divergent homeobox isoform X2 n=1 Tax=Xenopus tropicalis TaxID=8364 RepID=A0A8J0SXF1_XENTR|nr:highly divergent homeobox isoform X2 [Xenopus tropicalis]|eukprot:XP_012824916.1 PREDICTED: highly divergent homeobox isoform X2 [Xenopus tropicalis]
MEGSVAPNVGEVTSTGSQGYQPEMNLRSVFTTEQQRILQRYYDNGMTNQSKSCFQLILQCAQETKLDFSVVRTWVGNKRRKMSSSKSYTDSGTALPGSVSNSPSRPPEVSVRNVPKSIRTQPLQTSCNSDLVMNCVYSTSNSLTRQGSTPPTTSPKTETLKPNLPRPTERTEGEYLKMHVPVQRQAPVSKSSLQQLDEKTVMVSRQPSVANPPNSLYAKKNFSVSTGQMLERIAPQKTMTWSIKSVPDPPGGQRLYKSERPSVSPTGHVFVGQRNRESSCGLKNLEIREVFSLAATEHSSRTLGGTVEDRPRLVESSCFSIAMETGDVDDEYAREEELASMAAQNHACLRYRENDSSPNLENHCALSPTPVRTGTCKTMAPNTREEGLMYQNRDYYLSHNTSTHNTTSTQYPGGNVSRNSMHPPYTASPQLRLSQNQNNYQISGNLTVPWITECSRKRTLQDRTQFSDHDLAMLKKYWDNGMTSLGSVCREKIEAVASELNVDCEIVRTWIGNRRRKYRLMGIEVPPPRGGPATFSESGSSSLPSVEDPVAEVAEDNDRNDDVSICLSEESSQDEMPEVVRNEDIAIKGDCHDSVPVHNVKVEVVEEDITDAVSKFDVEQMRSLLDYKNEEMRYMENELENYKQKFAELQTFTKNLIQAVKSNDKEQQQILLAESPLELEDMDYSHPSPEPEDTSYSMSSVSEKNTPDSV